MANAATTANKLQWLARASIEAEGMKGRKSLVVRSGGELVTRELYLNRYFGLEKSSLRYNT